MKVAVVILNWNGRKLLEEFLPSVVLHSPQASIVVADNASTDDSVAYLQTHFPSVQIIQNSTNLGFAQGYNEALRYVDADVYALVNSDIEVTQNWLIPVIEAFNADDSTAIVQPKIRDFRYRDRFEYAGAAGGFLDKFGYPFCRGRIFETLETDQGQYDDDCDIFWASGACFFIRSEIYHKLGGFDIDFFAHQEEIDLCWRAKNHGYSVRYIAGSVVYHIGGATLQQGHPRKTYLNFRNSLLMLHKNLPTGNRYSILFQRLVLDGIAGIQFLFRGMPRHTMAIINAHFGFYKLMKSNALKRDAHQEQQYFKIKSIVWSYYLKGKKFYTTLF